MPRQPNDSAVAVVETEYRQGLFLFISVFLDVFSFSIFLNSSRALVSVKAYRDKKALPLVENIRR